MAKKGPPPADIRDYLTYDPETGLFHRVKLPGRGGNYADPAVGNLSPRGYIEIRHMGVLYRAHILAWWFVYGVLPPDGFEIDHRDADRANNRISNLRLATRSQNNANQKAKPGRLKGASFDAWSGKWKASLKTAGKNLNLGRYHTEEEAARAYDAAALQHFGEFARLNFQE